MAYVSEVTPGMYFVWRTKRPHVPPECKSPVFSFLDAEWFLEMRFLGPEDYWFYLHKMTEWGNCEPFEVVAWIEAFEFVAWIEFERRESTPIHCQRTVIKRGDTNIWETREGHLPKEIHDFKDDDYFTFVCMFAAVSPSGQKKESKHQSIQISSDLPFNTENLSLDTRRPLTKVPTPHRSIQAPLEFPPDLEGLSLDLGNLLEKGTMTDVQLKCGNVIVRAHRSVLIARSEVFEAMFRNDMVESRSGVVDMPDMDSEVLESLLKYVYTGKIPEVSVDLMHRLYAASNKYAIHGLKKGCSEWMTRRVSEENYLDYLVFADSHGDAPFKDAVVSFIIDNQGVVFKSRAWLHFQEQQPKLTIEVLNRCFVK